MRRLITITLMVMLAAIFAGCCRGTNTHNIEMMVTDITLNKISATDIAIDASFQIENPNTTDATLEKMGYDVHFGHKSKWILLGHGRRDTLTIEANSTANIVITVLIEDEKIRSLLELMFGTDPSRIKVEGDAWFKVESDSFKISFQKEIIKPGSRQSGMRGYDGALVQATPSRWN